MKKLILLLLILFSVSHSFAQDENLSEKEKARREKNIQAGNPFKRFGYTPKIATLSKGKYLEFHDLDSVVRIGSFTYNVKRKTVVGYTKLDTVHPESTLRPEIISRWFSPDPLSDEFPSWSPYNFVYNNPIMFIDPDGRSAEWIVGKDKNINGGKATYVKNSDGTITWTNATDETIKIGNAMLETEQGKQSLDNWIGSTATAYEIKIDTETSANDAPGYAETLPTKDSKGNYIVKNGVFEKATVTFYDNAIKEWGRNEKSRFFGASETEVYGANATHEEGHSRPSQIVLDKKHSNEKTQNASKNIPMNNEIRYRDQYHIKHPSSDKNWKNLYNRHKQLKKFMKNYEKTK